MIIALAGGVGGARLARGLARILNPEDLLVVVNTGDDFRHLGLRISPDLDTVTYTLAGRADPQTGWGLADDSGRVMAALEALGGETWFRLGDADLATHLERTRRLDAGESLGAATAALALLKGLPLKRAVVTGDAAFCRRALCETIRDGGGDYLFAVKANRPGSMSDILQTKPTTPCISSRKPCHPL